MGASHRYAKRRSRKRKGFHGQNHWARENEEQTPLGSPTSASTGASAAKLNCSTISEPERDNSETDIVTNCNFIIESDLFMSLILMIGKCPDCVGSVNIEHKLNDKMGLAQFFDISCSDCPWKLRFCSSKQCKKATPTHGRSGYDINRRTIVAFRENGIGFSGIESFCRCMNMPKPMSKTTFDDISTLIHNAYVETSHESMSRAAKEVHTKMINNDITAADKDGIVNISASGDGAWQKRGFSSLNGVMTLISEGKCIDHEVMSKKCKQCDVWNHKRDRDRYAE